MYRDRTLIGIDWLKVTATVYTLDTNYCLNAHDDRVPYPVHIVTATLEQLCLGKLSKLKRGENLKSSK